MRKSTAPSSVTDEPLASGMHQPAPDRPQSGLPRSCARRNCIRGRKRRTNTVSLLTFTCFTLCCPAAGLAGERGGGEGCVLRAVVRSCHNPRQHELQTLPSAPPALTAELFAMPIKSESRGSAATVAYIRLQDLPKSRPFDPSGMRDCALQVAA